MGTVIRFNIDRLAAVFASWIKPKVTVTKLQPHSRVLRIEAAAATVSRHSFVCNQLDTGTYGGPPRE